MKKLYHYSLSPFCRKVRIVLAEKALEVQLIEENFWERRLEFLKMNHAGTVPVLADGDLILSDSAAIFEYLEEVCIQAPLLPASAFLKAEARRLSFWFDIKFHREVTENLLYERIYKKVRRAGYPDSNRIKDGVKNFKLHLHYMSWLLEERKWLAGDQMSIADISAASHLSCLDYINDVDWNLVPFVKDWYSKIKSRPSFRPILSDHLSGFIPPIHYADLDF